MEKMKISLKEIGLPKLVMIFVAGILLILLSFPNLFGSKEAKDKGIADVSDLLQQNGTNMTSQDTNTYIEEMENRLENILKKVSGIGEVEVMITLKASKEQIPLKDSPYMQESLNEDDGEGGNRANNSIQREESTVLVTNENGKTQPYVIQEREPIVEGVLVIAEGGDNVRIIKDIMEAAEVLFDVPVHKVKVMKMSDGIK
ncbi:stage III sporulation protein AG [Mobilitalea sibirica]|uniref:Stage III sporulation protein AG n=1 Tax=Mobilitalea sibirica TaxID=1462919 RepID=A0A8J7H1G5_9FIRM|nr:stage III sporulation protein AG [Mobilitalea sibirica]MBH1940202.1 stage III sporulation protein AG [Mobilitalea sibirica]